MSFLGLFGHKKKDATPTWDMVKGYIDQLNKPSPERQALTDRGNAILADETRPGFDLTQSKELAPYLKLFARGKASDAALTNLGAASWGTNQLQATNPEAAARLNAQMQGALTENSQGMLADAYAGLHGEALDLLSAGAGEQVQRTQGATSAALSGYGTYLNRPRTGFWSNFRQSFGSSLGRFLGGGNVNFSAGIPGLPPG